MERYTQMMEEDNIEENCSICGKVMKAGEGRFRMADQVLWGDCYYKKHHPSTSKKDKE